MEDTVYVDVESVKTSERSLVFSVTMKKVRGDQILITRTLFNTDTISYVSEYDQSMVRKITRTIKYLHDNNEPNAIFVTTLEMLHKIQDFIYRHGRVWVGHSLDRDLGFLYDTDKYFETKFFSVHPSGNDEICTQGYKWGRIAKVCTQCIIPKRAPNFYKMFKDNMTLEKLIQFCLPNEAHDHTSPSDVDHLIRVVEYIRNKDAQTFYIGSVSTYINKS